MPKITVHGGPSYEGDSEWPGNNSSELVEKQQTLEKQSELEDLSPALMTENPSEKDQKEPSSAPLTDGKNTDTEDYLFE